MDFTTILTLLATGIPGFIALVLQFRKDKRDIDSSLLEDIIKIKEEIQGQKEEIQAECGFLKKELAMYKKEIDNAQEKLLSMQEDILIMQKKLVNLRKGVSILLAQLKKNNIQPEWIPSKEDLS